MPLDPSQLLDATPETKKYFKRRLFRAPVDYESFMTPLRLCDIGQCFGMCCHDGVCLDDDEEHYVAAVVDAHPVFFRQTVGVTSENAFEDAIFLDSETRKTRTRRFKYPPHANYPKHFPQTSCVFRMPDGKCALQALAMQHGEHPWAYKPLSCWLHPISLERDDRTMLWIPTKETDHLREPDYPGYAPYTHCGCATPGGKPAYQILKMEIETLGAIVGRDFWGEMDRHWRTYHASPNGRKQAAAGAVR